VSDLLTRGDVVVPRSIARTMTGIEWTDFTGNPWVSCTRIIANTGGRSGCDICYAAEFAQNRLGLGWGPGAPRVAFSSFAARMRRLDRLAKATGMPFSVFSLSLGDWLDQEAPADLRALLIETVEACPHLTWLLLTHRPHLAARLLPAAWRTSPPANVWPGVTVDHPLHGYRWERHHAPFWAHTGRAWVSAEPLAASLASIDLSGAAVTIYGGASGTSDATWEFRPEWVAEAVDRYGEDRVFFKQRGDFIDGKRVGKKAAGRDLSGRFYNHLPWPTHREILKEAAK
jgi:protein gp37